MGKYTSITPHIPASGMTQMDFVALDPAHAMLALPQSEFFISFLPSQLDLSSLHNAVNFVDGNNAGQDDLESEEENEIDADDEDDIDEDEDTSGEHGNSRLDPDDEDKFDEDDEDKDEDLIGDGPGTDEGDDLVGGGDIAGDESDADLDDHDEDEAFDDEGDDEDEYGSDWDKDEDDDEFDDDDELKMVSSLNTVDINRLSPSFVHEIKPDRFQEQPPTRPGQVRSPLNSTSPESN
jgi:hypothetical protein